jgi:hypothetical protein
MLASIGTDLKQKSDEIKRHSSNLNNAGMIQSFPNGISSSTNQTSGIRVSSVSSAPFSPQKKQTIANASHTNSLENLKNSLSASSFYSSPMKSVKFADDLLTNRQPQQQKEQETATDKFINNPTIDNQYQQEQEQQQEQQQQSNQIQLYNSSPVHADSIFDSTIEPIYSSYSSCMSKEENQRVSPKTIWKNDPKLLIRSSCNFIVQVN